jgi:hypothetical protein
VASIPDPYIGPEGSPRQGKAQTDKPRPTTAIHRRKIAGANYEPSVSLPAGRRADHGDTVVDGEEEMSELNSEAKMSQAAANTCISKWSIQLFGLDIS